MNIVREHPPVVRRSWKIVLSLSKSNEGVSWKESVAAGGSNNLPCRIRELRDLGHCFVWSWEQQQHTSSYKRYWWVGFNANGSGYSAKKSEASHIGEEHSACPPVVGSKRATPSLRKGGRRRA